MRNYELDRFFDSIFDVVPYTLHKVVRTPIGSSFMYTDVVEKDDKYVIHVDVPGFNKEDIKISLEDNVLEISAERSSEEKNEEGTYIRRERHSGKQFRTLRLPEGITEEDIKAKFNNGVLEIEVPKVKEEIPEKKTIEIE